MRAVVFGFLSALISVAFATSFSTCGTDNLGITSVTLSENPITPGSTLTVQVVGTPKVSVTSGTLVESVIAYGVTVKSTSYDICSDVGLTCPLSNGVQFTGSVSQTISSTTPAVSTATLKIVAKDGSGNQISCIQVSISVSSSPREDEESDDLLREEFEKYKVRFNKHYSSEGEESIRFYHFKNSVERVTLKNTYGDNIFGLTKFSDMSPEEFSSVYLNYRPRGRMPNTPVITTKQAAPTAFDWRDAGVVTPVKNQGYCGSCWAFSIVETIESAWYLAGNPLTTFSEQQVVSCDTGDAGCNGGNPPIAYAYVEKAGGLATEEDYPYESSSGTAPPCSNNFTVSGGAISGFSYATGPCYGPCSRQDEDTLASTLASTQPVSVCVDASQWSDYTGGVMTTKSCSSKYLKLDHCVQLVGYNQYNGVATSSTDGYWIVRNSWDDDWGEEGYIYLQMGTNTCGVADEATIVTIA